MARIARAAELIPEAPLYAAKLKIVAVKPWALEFLVVVCMYGPMGAFLKHGPADPLSLSSSEAPVNCMIGSVPAYQQGLDVKVQQDLGEDDSQ